MKPVFPHFPPRRATWFSSLTLSILLFMSSLCAPSAAARTADTLRVSSALDELFVDPAFYSVLEDPTGKLTLNQVRQPARAGQFRAGSQLPTTTMDHPGAAYWMRLIIRADGQLQQHWYLEMFDSHLNQVEFFPADGAAPTITGSDLPLFTRKFPYKNFLFRLPLQPNQTQTYYLRLQSSSKTTFLSRLRTEQPLANHFQAEYGLLGGFYGILLIMVVYNLCLYLFIGEQTYLRYVLYVLSCSLVFLSEDGLGFQYLWPDYPALNELIVAGSPILLLLTFSYYARQFLDMPLRLPHFDRWVRGVVILSVVGLIIDALWLNSGWGFWFYLLPYGLLLRGVSGVAARAAHGPFFPAGPCLGSHQRRLSHSSQAGYQHVHQHSHRV